MSAAHEEVLYSDISEKTLHVGDVITLCVQREGKIFCVGSEGFVELGCSLRELDLSTAVPWTFVDCQWVVHVKCQYYAQKRMKKALKRKDGEKLAKQLIEIYDPANGKLIGGDIEGRNERYGISTEWRLHNAVTQHATHSRNRKTSGSTLRSQIDGARASLIQQFQKQMPELLAV